MADIDSFTTYVQDKLDTVLSAAEAAANDLTAIAEGRLATFEFSAVPDYQPNVGYSPQDLTLNNVAPFQKPNVTLTEYQRIETTDVTPFDWSKYDDILNGFSPQEFNPDAVDGEISGFAARIITYLDSGGPGVSDAVQAALINNQQERDAQLLADALLYVSSSDAMSGFPFPTSMTMAARNELIKKYQDDRSNRNREITALMTERAHATAMNALNQGVALTGIKANFAVEVWKLYYSMLALILDEFKTRISAAVAVYEAEIRKVLADYEILKTRAMLENGINLEIFKVLVGAEETRLRSDTTLATAGAEVILKSSELNLTAGMKQAELELNQFLKTVDFHTERGKADIEQLLANNARRVAAAQSQAEYYKGIIQSLANMINTIQTTEE